MIVVVVHVVILDGHVVAPATQVHQIADTASQDQKKRDFMVGGSYEATRKKKIDRGTVSA